MKYGKCVMAARSTSSLKKPHRMRISDSRRSRRTAQSVTSLPKSASGIRGLDDITGGGLPTGRPTLVCGSAGCGKTLFAMEVLVRGATEHNEPGVFMSFEEKAEELTQNVRSLGFDLNKLIAQKKLFIDHVHVERSEIEEAGDFDLEPIFIRLGQAINAVKAKRVVLDTIETLFGGFSDAGILRAELRRLFRWLKDRGVTAVITGERGEGMLTRQGLEEYVSDCVILLDHRVNGQISTRRLRIVKYRGTTHGTNEYPFLIGEDGIVIFPMTAIGLDHPVSAERIPSGVPELDEMLGGRGYYRGTTVLVSGTAGVGKTSLAAHLADVTARRKERCIYFAFEESQAQLMRNMRSIGIDLAPHVKSGRVRFESSRPNLYGLETHLAMMYKVIDDYGPQVVIIDPISNLAKAGTDVEAGSMLVRLIDHLKGRQITAMFTNLTSGETNLEGTDLEVSSLIDTWILLRDLEQAGERNRVLCVLKSRGMAHSNQLREFILTDKGIRLIPAYLGPGGVLTGSARVAQEARDKAAATEHTEERQRRESELERKKRMLKDRIAALQAEFEVDAGTLGVLISQDRREQELVTDRLNMAKSRQAKAREAHRKPNNGRI